MGSRIQQSKTAFSLDPSGRDQARIRDPQHLAFIRTLPSVISGRGPCEACHIRYGDPIYNKKRTGKAQKPSDAWSVPMTAAEHRSQHDSNEAKWWAKQGIDPLAVARALYIITGDTEAALLILNRARNPAPRLWPTGTSDGD